MPFARRAAYFTPAREHLVKSTGTRILRSSKLVVAAAPFQVIDLNSAPRGIRTGQGAWRMTRSAVLPRMTLS